jgi:hypothetical protein
MRPRPPSFAPALTVHPSGRDDGKRCRCFSERDVLKLPIVGAGSIPPLKQTIDQRTVTARRGVVNTAA